MEEPYTTFDTFTVGENLAPGEDPLAPAPQAPILARLPRLAVGDRKSNRFDFPEKGSPEKGFSERSLPEVHQPTAPAPAKALAYRGTNNPAATIRFDTILTDNGFVQADQVEVDQPMAAREQAISLLEVPASENQPAPSSQKETPLYPIAELDSWLLNLEATVMPYSRWIALAAVIAALGLTMILLRSSAPATLGDTLLPSNQVNHLTSTDALAGVNETSPSEMGLSETDKGLHPLESPSGKITNAYAISATGPTGHVTQPRAKLTQQVQPIEPFRVRAETERVEVASKPSVASYPRTAASGPLAPKTFQGSTLR